MAAQFNDLDRVVYTGPDGFNIMGERVSTGAIGEVDARIPTVDTHVCVYFKDTDAVVNVPVESLTHVVSLVKKV